MNATGKLAEVVATLQKARAELAAENDRAMASDGLKYARASGAPLYADIDAMRAEFKMVQRAALEKFAYDVMVSICDDPADSTNHIFGGIGDAISDLAHACCALDRSQE